MATEENHELRNSMNGLSMSDLIGAPLKAVVDAQAMLAKSTVDFIRDVGLEKDSDGTDKTRDLSLTVRKTEDDGTTNELAVQAPLLAIVPIPSLAVEEVNVEFQMEVTSMTKEDSSTAGEKDTELTEDGVSVCGKVSSQASGTRETNQSAKYQIQVKARKQETPEGLSRVLDALAQSVNGKQTAHNAEEKKK